VAAWRVPGISGAGCATTPCLKHNHEDTKAREDHEDGEKADLNASVLPATPLGRLTEATFVNTSGGPRAGACEAELLSGLLGDAPRQTKMS
jgi:hypothetical protein